MVRMRAAGATLLRYAPHGQGTLKTADGGERSGNFVRGQLIGDGRSTDADGAVYEGSFANGVRNGVGTCTYADSSAARALGRMMRGMAVACSY